MNPWVPVLLAAVLISVPGSAARQRIGTIPGAGSERPRSGGSLAWTRSAAGDSVSGAAPWRRDAVVAAGAGLLSAMAVGGWRGIAIGAVLAAVTAWGMRRWGHRQQPDDPLAVAAALDLLSACVRAGLPVAAAVEAAAGVCSPHAVAGRTASEKPERAPIVTRVDGSSATSEARRRDTRRSGDPAPGGGSDAGQGAAPRTGSALHRVADLIALGGDAADAWGALGEEPGLESIARMARRSADSGASLATDAEELAEALRQGAGDDAVAAAEKAGVAIAGPLGVCFLPAFVCLGIAPVIVGLAGSILGGNGIGP